MPKPYPREFREDVVAVAREGEDTIAQIAKDFRASPSPVCATGSMLPTSRTAGVPG